MDLPFPLYVAGVAEMIFLIPITALMIPIVAIWTGHRRAVLRMKLDAQIRMGQASAQNQGEVQALRAEVRELREQLHAQVITMDSLIANQAKLLDSPARVKEIQSRLGADESKASQNRTNMEKE